MVSVADSKYANLPGIAYDQPDCYETADLPESEQNEDYPEEENICIERLHLNATEAFSKFKGHSLSTKGVDFSDRLSRNRRTGYDARSGNWELVAEGERETPMQKFQRIQCEIKELIEEVSLLKETSRDEMTMEKIPRDLMVNQLDQAQKQLVEMRLEETLGSELIQDLADPQGSQLKRLLTHLDELGSRASDPKASEKGSKEKVASKEKPGSKESSGPSVRYELNLRAEPARQQNSARLVQLEAKIAKLEALLGSGDAKLGGAGLLAAASRIEARANIVDVAALDAADARLTVVLAKMDAAKQRTSVSGITAEQEAKINELYEFVRKTDEAAAILPETLARMEALETLHLQAADFSKSLTQLEEVQRQLSASLRNNAGLVEAVEKNMEANMATLKGNMTALGARIQALAPPKKK